MLGARCQFGLFPKFDPVTYASALTYLAVVHLALSVPLSLSTCRVACRYIHLYCVWIIYQIVYYHYTSIITSYHEGLVLRVTFPPVPSRPCGSGFLTLRSPDRHTTRSRVSSPRRLVHYSADCTSVLLYFACTMHTVTGMSIYTCSSTEDESCSYLRVDNCHTSGTCRVMCMPYYHTVT